MDWKAFVIVVLFALGGLAYVIVVLPIRNENRELERRIQELQAQQNERREEIIDLQRLLEKLEKKDAETIERILREKYGYCREGETIIRFKEPAPQKTSDGALPDPAK